MTSYIESADHAGIFVPHAFDEHTVDLGEITASGRSCGSPRSTNAAH
ncbi:hypothetical protein [Jatrophihabitans lederbergiae]|uniref:Uncharacterized protein n=1 Tax=Jatrophihabitans lederbergiae TaxID=3075547 RepID=A0ABU2JHN4_9ACTN|nr:hypothetical protein [Jatrophihabitans sp. DSM 44399]MDT0264495.1 hypothetical protein [Jatrophihabitans sp. DSM 44399]